MESPTLFYEIYRKCFGMAYDMSQESTWCWLTNEHIGNFFSPTYTKDDGTHSGTPGPCILQRKGHQPKMFLWMIEEYVYILSQLCINDLNGQMVLGHELLLLTCNRCCRKRGGGQGSCHTGIQPVDRLQAISLDRLKHVICSNDTFLLERLAWGVYDNMYGPGDAPDLTGFKTYGQVLKCLVEKIYKGHHMHCPVHTFTSFNTGKKVEVNLVVMVQEKSEKSV